MDRLFLLVFLSFQGRGGGCANLMIFILKVFTFWFVRESIIPGNFGFARY